MSSGRFGFSKRSSNTRHSSDHVFVPEYFFDKDYKVDRNLLKNDSTAHEALKQMGRQLNVIDKELEISISRNIDFFNEAFGHIDNVKDDMNDIRNKCKVI